LWLKRPELFGKLPTEFQSNTILKTGLYPVSLDRVYYSSEIGLDLTRLVDKKRLSKGLGRRADSSPLLTQFRALRDMGLEEVVLVDDVIFSGDMMRRTVELLTKMGIRTPVVCVGIGIAEGINQLNGFGQEVYCVRKYEDVVDEICERDFYPGVPMCGRSLEGDENIGVPCVLPFGKPTEWASIPVEWQESLSRFCIGQSIKLFEEIGRRSGREVTCQDLDRSVFLLPRDNTSVVKSLRHLV
jgi:hypothetical protein